MFEALGIVLALALGPLIGRYVVRPVEERRARKAQAGRPLLCALRLAEGEQGGVSRWWWARRTRVEAGSLRWGRHRVPVTGVTDDFREPRVRDMLLVNPDSEIVEITTPTAVLEMALTPADRAWLPAALAPG